MTVQGGINDLVGALVVLQLQKLVQRNGKQAAHRQQEDEPGMLPSQVGHKMEGMMEACADQAA